MRIHIELTDTRDPRAPAKVFDFPDGPVSLGRSLQNQVVIDGETISRVHTVLSFAAGRWSVMHQGSVAPTELNGAPVDRGVPAPLSSGDVVRVAHFELRLTMEDPYASARETLIPSAGDPMRATVMPVAVPYADPEMTISAGQAVDDRTQVHRAAPGPAGRVVPTLVGRGDAGETWKLELREVGRSYQIGRSSGADLTIPLASISRVHATVRYDGMRVYAADAGARNPLRVNGREIAGETPLRPGDTLSLGPVDLRLLSDDPSAGAGQTISLASGAARGGGDWAADADVPALEPMSSGQYSMPPQPAPAGGSWDQMAQSGGAGAGGWAAPAAPAAPSWDAPAPAAPAPSAPAAWDAPAADAWGAPPAAPPAPAHEAAPAWGPPPAEPWGAPPGGAGAGLPPAPPPIAPPAPPSPMIGVTPIMPAPVVPSWTPPAVPAAPVMPTFAAPTPPAFPATPGVQVNVNAPPPPGAPKDPSQNRVIARRASDQKGWLVAGIVCMAVALVVGTLVLVSVG